MALCLRNLTFAVAATLALSTGIASASVPDQAAGQTADQAAGTPGKVNVFFSEWSADVSAESQTIIKEAVAKADLSQGLHIKVTGYADTTGSEAANKLLSQLRAQVVSDALMADGVSKDAIELAAAGETPTAGIKQQSRRVTIDFAAP